MERGKIYVAPPDHHLIELTTLNEELQHRNTELSQVNNDLSNLLSSVSMPIVMLGNDLTIRHPGGRTAFQFDSR